MQSMSATEGPIEIFRKLLLANKSIVERENKLLYQHLDEDFLKIDEDIGDVLFAFQELESWKKQVVSEFEKKIQLINNSALSSQEFDHLIKDFRREVHETKQKVGNYLPQLGFGWATGKKGRGQEMGNTSKMTVDMAKKTYEGMDELLKSCFLCFSIFPSNSIIKRRGLINWWIGEGFVYAREDKTAQQVGEQCFETLLNMGLFESVNKKGNNKNYAKRCKVDTMIRSVAISIAKKNGFFDFDSERGPTSGSPHHILRSSFISAQGSQNKAISVFPPTDYSELISLLNLDGQCVKFDGHINYRLNNLIVLQIGQWPGFNPGCHPVQVMNADVFMKFLLSLKKLRYLGLQGVYGVKELSHNIDELSELLILDLRACHNLERLPSSIGRLRKLAYLNISQCYVIKYIPSSIQELENLQVLEGFVLGESSDTNDQADLSHLVKLKMLRKLSLSFGVKAKISESQLKDGKFLEGLRSVTLIWQWDSTNSRENLCPSMTLDWLPSCLEKLDLRCFPSEKIPTGLRPSNFSNLKRLYFRGSSISSLNGLHNDGGTWQIENLCLKYMKSLHIDSLTALLDRLPHIRSVEILGCPKISGLHGSWIRDQKTTWERHAVEQPNSVDMTQANFSGERYNFSFIGKTTLKTSYRTTRIMKERASEFMRHFLFERIVGLLVFFYTWGVFLVGLGDFFLTINLILIPLIMFVLVVRESVLSGLGVLIESPLLICTYDIPRVVIPALFQEVRGGVISGLVFCFCVWLAASGRHILGVTVIVIGTIIGAGFRLNNNTLDGSNIGIIGFIIYIIVVLGRIILAGLSTDGKRRFILLLGVLELVHLELYGIFTRKVDLQLSSL